MLRMTRALGALALSLLLVSPVLASDRAKGDAGLKEAAGLCTAPHATVVMSCRTKDDHLIAICSQENGAFQLAFEKAGKANARVVLPKALADKTGVRVGWLMYSGGGGSYGRFEAGHGKEYVVYSGSGKGWEQAGLAEVQGEDHLAEHICLPAAKPYDIGFPLLGEKLGYATDESQSFEIDVQ